MDAQALQTQIDSINAKLDLIVEEIELQRRHRRAMDDLKDDLMRVGKDLYQTAVTELEEVHDHMDTGDMLFLGKKLLRNVKTLTRTVEQLENARDFVQDFAPVSRELFQDMLARLDELDRKGYFAFARELTNVSDRVVTSFSVDDVRHLGDNIVTILNTVKNLTQPDMLHAINNAVSVYEKLDIEIKGDVSLLSLMKQMNTPEVKRGLAFALQFLKSLAEQKTNGHALAPTSPMN